jgi:NAD(P)-dependent dehydrogenase (short-subunit alcohol dehydrogenase family)
MSTSALEILNLFSVKDKVVLVTGGSSGIGYMIAKALVKNGAKVYISSRKASACESVSAELTKMGPGSCHSLPADLINEANCLALVEQLKKKEKKLHVLFNNAGATWGDTIENHPESAWHKIYNLNVFSIFHLTRACLPLLEAAATAEDPARVINISSIDGLTTNKFSNNYAYSSSKAAVIHMTRVLGLQLSERKVLVNSIAPGLVYSKMTKFLFDDKKDSSGYVVNNIPLKRTGEDSDIGGLSIFLSSRASAWITGTTIVLDGGSSLSSSSKL